METKFTAEKRERVECWLSRFGYDYTVINSSRCTRFVVENMLCISPTALETLIKVVGQYPCISVCDGKLEISFLY